MKKFVIARSSLQSTYPLAEYLVISLCLDKWISIPEINGAWYCLVVVHALSIFVRRRDETCINIDERIKNDQR